MVEAEGGTEPRKTNRRWERHLGLIAGGATSILISLKLLAVANWNPTTAFGILSANGTANVLTGALLAALPLVYSYGFILFFPFPRVKMKSLSPSHRQVVWTLVLIAATILFLVTPSYLTVTIILTLSVLNLIPWGKHTFRRRRATAKDHQRADEDEHSGPLHDPERQEGSRPVRNAAVVLTFVVFTAFSLGTPWFPSEIVDIDGVGQQAGYVLNTNDGKSVVLLARDRKLRQVDADKLSGQYCQYRSRWLSYPTIGLIGKPLYSPCPR